MPRPSALALALALALPLANLDAPALAQDAEQEEDAGITMHGALRLEYALRTWDEVQRERGGNFDLELFRLGFDGKLHDILLSAQYRWYVNQGFDTLHHAWVGYDLPQGRVKLGVVQVPFGLLPYASHSWWFGLGYYVGLEDDYDAGVVYEHGGEDSRHQFHLAFFKQQELSASQATRYSFDLVRGDAGGGDPAQQNEEQNQLNLRWAYALDEERRSEVGLSGMLGQIYNHSTRRMGDRWAAAAHGNWHQGRWNLQLQATAWRHDPENPPGVADTSVQGGFFHASNLIPAEGRVYTANLAYEWPRRFGPVESILFYNDHSLLQKDVPGWRDSWLNTTGALLTAGPVYTYVDFVYGRNASFVGPYDADSNDSTRMLQGNGDRELRVNINLGYYF